MSTFHTQRLPINTANSLNLQATFYRSKDETRPYLATILYFHGGGLIFGEREDLPDQYISLLTEAGYGILALDYPLAPESKINQIIQASQQAIEWFLAESSHELGIETSTYYLMGRSAGAYLALFNAFHAPIQPKGIIAFYGYYNLNEASFNVPNRHFLQYPKVSEQTVQQLINPEPIVSAPMDERFPIYIAARQQGNWSTYIMTEGQSGTDFSLTKSQLAQLPPLFITAASNDPDVPVRQSKFLNKFGSDTELHIIDSNEHDFDRTQIDTLGMPIYQKLVDWLQKQ